MDDEIDDGLAYGRQVRLRRWTVDSFFSSRLCETAMLEECVSDHGHERVHAVGLGSILFGERLCFSFGVALSMSAGVE